MNANQEENDYGRKNLNIPRVVYICAAIEILITLGGSISGVPSIRLLENAVCQRFYDVQTILAEDLCKGNGVQTAMAQLLGAMSSFASLPTLLLTLPYGILAEHFDRRVILLVNFMSAIASMLYMLVICYSTKTDLRLIWLSGLFDIFGGGGSVAQILLRTMIAESVPSASLSTVLYRLSGISTLVRLLGGALGSWLLGNGAPSAMLIGLCINGLTIPLLTFLPSSDVPSYDDYEEEIELQKLDPDTISLDDMPHTTQPDKQSVTQTLLAFKHLLLHNRAFTLCLVILALNTLALESRALLRPWISKRYVWSLSTTGYILSLESLFGVLILFILQHLNSRPCYKSTDEGSKRKRELGTAMWSMVCAIVGSVVLGFAETRVGFILGALVMGGSIGFMDSIKAFFTAMVGQENNQSKHNEHTEQGQPERPRDGNGKRDIGRLYSATMIVEYIAIIISAPVWSAIYSWGYALGGLGLGIPFLVAAGLLGGVLGLVGKARMLL